MRSAPAAAAPPAFNLAGISGRYSIGSAKLGTVFAAYFMTLANLNSIRRGVRRAASSAFGIFAVLALLAGCESAPTATIAARSSEPAAARGTAAKPAEAAPAQAQPNEDTGKLAEIVTIREGDVVKISFPGAPKLDTTQQVRADGIVTLDILGEIKVTGLNPKDLEKMLSQMFASQLVSNEVSVAIISSSFDVYVMGAVLRPGKISATKPLTAFQAIMEAGYDPINSNLEKVTLIREVGRSKYTYIPLNLQLVLEGKDTSPYYLKPSDTLQVPKKITIF